MPFGETVFFKLPKVAHMPGDFQDRFETGVWLGCTVRSGEHLIGTPKGIFKVSSVMRRADDRRWSEELIKGIVGSPMGPVPGSGHSRVTAFAKHHGSSKPTDARFVPPPPQEEPEVKMAYIYNKDIEKYGPTEGCPGCRAALNPASSFRAKHTPECRRRLEEEIKKTVEGKKRFERAEERMTKVVARKFEDIMEEDAKGTAGGSGLTAEDRDEGLRKAKDDDKTTEPTNDADMQPDQAQGEQSQQPSGASEPGAKGEQIEQDRLEEAPRPGTDKRFPLDPRNPAQKRYREYNSPKAQSKWQAF